MTLEKGSKIGRYEIRSLLGAGGMGEVYLAFDTKLERNVALKLLTKSDNKEHLARFKQEAKAIIALNHPHILTVYEFGQHENQHFIVTEYLQGKTLRETLKEDSISLADAVEIGVQIANALSSAHGAGIIHRDIKPENIMILPDGYIKVLDFGLAKMTGAYNQPAQKPEDSTASLLQTKAGMIMGTVNYMSPEQIRGKDIDERTDIWSLGVVLFEIIGKTRPFDGDSIGEVIAAVLEHQTPLLSNFNPKISEEVEETIYKALQKNKLKRYQTAHDFAADLKKAKIGIESGKWLISADTLRQNQLNLAESDSVGTAKPDPQNLPDKKKETLTNPNLESNLNTQIIKQNRLGWIVMIFLIFLFAGTGFYLFSGNDQIAVKKDWKTKRLTTNGNVINAAISPDGKFIAYIQEEEGNQSLWLKQVSETAGRELTKPSSKNYSKLTFSPDGNTIYFVVFEKTPFGTLYRIPFLGESPQKILENVDSNITFSPDGKRFAFIRSITKEGVDQILTAKIDGSDKKVLAERKKPLFYTINTREGLAWSNDGKTIAAAAGQQTADGENMSVIEIDAETGEEKVLSEQQWARVGKIIWTKDGKNLYLTAADHDTNLYQIVLLNKDSGKVEKITNELSDYLNISLSENDDTMLSVVKSDISNTFLASLENPQQAVQIAKGNHDGRNGLKFMPDGKILYVSLESGNNDIWKMDADGKNRIQLSFDKAADEYPTVSPDGKFVIFVSNRTGVPHIWRMNADGSQPIQLTDRGGESFPTVTPDAESVIFSSRTPNQPMLLWKVPIGGGQIIPKTSEQTHWASVSPDGKLIACLTLLEQENNVIKLAIVSAENGKLIKTFDSVGSIASPNFPPVLRWTHDSRNIAYISTVQGVSNIMLQPVDSDKTRRLTDFSSDRIFSFDLSNDGAQIVFARGTSRNEIILFEDFSG